MYPIHVHVYCFFAVFYNFLFQVDGFRYRVENAMRAVTNANVKEARLRELKMEMLNSHKLKAHFEDNPRELDLLRHDKVLRPAAVQHALASVPSYLIPEIQVCARVWSPMSSIQIFSFFYSLSVQCL